MMNDRDLQLLLDQIFQHLIEELTMANRLGTLVNELEKYGLQGLLGESQPRRELEYVARDAKILILGDCSIQDKEICGIMKSLGLPAEGYEIISYSEIVNRGICRYEYNTRYSDILVGPVPHSAAGMEGASSLLMQLEQHPERYPRTTRIVDARGTLKISKSALRSALEKSRRLEIA